MQHVVIDAWGSTKEKKITFLTSKGLKCSCEKNDRYIFTKEMNNKKASIVLSGKTRAT